MGGEEEAVSFGRKLAVDRGASLALPVLSMQVLDCLLTDGKGHEPSSSG